MTLVIEESLANSRNRLKLIHHSFFNNLNEIDLDGHQLAILIGQYWHPIHYFTKFLAKCIGVQNHLLPIAAISKILYQESGQGNPALAHEQIYIDSMMKSGLPYDRIVNAKPFDETANLIMAYKACEKNYISALGGIYATEAADLTMVTNIGTAVMKVSSTNSNEWVDIHSLQEPDHTEQSDFFLTGVTTENEKYEFIEFSDLMWDAWVKFFDRIDMEVSRKAQ